MGSTRPSRRSAPQGVTGADLDRRSREAGRQKLIASVENLTGTTIDHYGEINLAGFVELTDALGGVSVCLNTAVRDSYSGIDLPAGQQSVSGAAALAFVRQRHGLDGGDLDRIGRQQAFAAGLAQRLQDGGRAVRRHPAEPAGADREPVRGARPRLGPRRRHLPAAPVHRRGPGLPDHPDRPGRPADAGGRDRRRDRPGRGAGVRRIGPRPVGPGRAAGRRPVGDHRAGRQPAARRGPDRDAQPSAAPSSAARRIPTPPGSSPPTGSPASTDRRVAQTDHRDRDLPAPAGPHPAVHPRRPPRDHRLPRRRPDRVPAQPGRHRPGELPVDAGAADRRRAAGRRPAGAGGRQWTRRGGPARRGAGTPRAQPGTGRRRGRVRHRPAGDDGHLRPVRPALRGRAGGGPDPAAGRHGGRGDRPAAGPARPARRVRRRPDPARARRDQPGTTALARPDGPEISYGLADFVAAEEMGRMRGYWWSPDGDALLVARVDDEPVPRWHIGDPEHPERPPTVVAYPAAGTRNARVDLWIVALDGARTRVRWDADATSTWSRRSGTARSCSSWCSRGTSGRCGCCGSTRPPGRPRCGTSRPTRPGWTSCPGCRRTPQTARWSPRPTRTARAGWSSTGSRSPRRSCRCAAVLDVDGDTVLFRGERRPGSIGLWTGGPRRAASSS